MKSTIYQELKLLKSSDPLQCKATEICVNSYWFHKITNTSLQMSNFLVTTWLPAIFFKDMVHVVAYFQVSSYQSKPVVVNAYSLHQCFHKDQINMHNPSACKKTTTQNY